jgi:hypothetical protein
MSAQSGKSKWPQYSRRVVGPRSSQDERTRSAFLAVPLSQKSAHATISMRLIAWSAQ